MRDLFAVVSFLVRWLLTAVFYDPVVDKTTGRGIKATH